MAAVAAPGRGPVEGDPGVAADRRVVLDRPARADRRGRSILQVPEAAPTRVSGAASGSVARATRAATTVPDRSPRVTGRGRRQQVPVVRGGASGGRRGRVRTGRVGRAGLGAVGPGIGLPARVAVARRLAAVRAGDPMTSGGVRHHLPGRVTGGRPATGRRSGTAHPAAARAATSAGANVPRVRPSTAAASIGRVSTGLVRIVRRSAVRGRTAVASVDRHRIGRGRPRRGRRRRSDRPFCRPISWPRTRSSSQDGGRSRRRSSRAAPPIACSSFPNAARRSSDSCSTRRASGSPSSRSKAGP